MTDPADRSSLGSELPLRHDERVEEAIQREASLLIITNQRLLLAESDALNLEWAIERPNVETIQSTSIGGERLREWGFGALVLGPILLVGGLVIPWARLSPASPLGEAEFEAGRRFGVEWALRLMEVVFTAVLHLDTALLVGGAIISVLGVAFFLGMVVRRKPVLAIKTADGRVFHSTDCWGLDERIQAELTTRST